MTVQGTGGVSSDDKRVQDGQKQCVRGAWVKISEEYKEWDVFRKFMGKVGRLTTRHLSGMWYAEFAGEDEYSFLCGPLLFQLEYSSAAEAERARLMNEAELKTKALANAEKEKMSRAYAEMHEKKNAEVAENTKRLFSILQSIQNELAESRNDTQMSQRMFQDLKYAADRLEADLKKTQSTLNITKGELKQAQMEFERSKKLEEDAMSSLKKARATVAERDAELSEMMAKLNATKKEVSESLAREADQKEQIKAQDQKIGELDAEVESCYQKLDQTADELERVRDELSAEVQRREDAEELAEQRRLELEELRKEHNEMIEANNKITNDLNEQMQGLSEAKDKAELELAERMRDDTDSESDGEDDDGGSEVGDLESMHGSRRKGKRGGSTTSSNHSSDHKPRKRELKELTIKCAELEREILRLKNEAKQFAAGMKALELVPELKGQIGSLETKLSMVDQERKKQFAAVQAANKQINELKQALVQAKNHAEELMPQIKRVEHDKEGLLGRIEGLEQDVAARDASLEQQRLQLERASADMARLEGDMSGELARLEGELQHAQGGWDAAKAEVAALKQEKEDTLAESWKVTEENDRLNGSLEEAVKKIGKLEEAGRRKDTARAEADKQLIASEKQGTEMRIRIKELQEELKKMDRDMKRGAAVSEHDKRLLTDEVAQLTARVCQYEFDLFVKRAVREARLECTVPSKPVRVYFIFWRYNVALHKAFDIAQAKRDMTRKVQRAEIEAVSLRKRLAASHRLVSELQRNNAAQTSAANVLSVTLYSAPSKSLQATRTVAWGDSNVAEDIANLSALTPLPSMAGDTPPPGGWSEHLEVSDAGTQTELSLTGRRGSAGGLKQKLLQTVLEGGRGREEDEAGAGEALPAVEEEGAGGVSDDADAELAVVKREVYRLEDQVASLGERLAAREKDASGAALEMEGLTQRNMRLQKETMTATESLKGLQAALRETQARLSELEKQANTLLGCLKLGEKTLSGVKDRRSLSDAKSVVQGLSIALIERERIIASQQGNQHKGGALIVSNVSPIVLRKAEMETDALDGKGKGAGATTDRGSRAPPRSQTPAATLEEVEDDLEGSIKMLQAQVSTLTDKLESGSAKRKARQMGFLSRADIPVASRDGLPELISSGYNVKGAPGMPKRPVSAMGRMN